MLPELDNYDWHEVFGYVGEEDTNCSGKRASWAIDRKPESTPKLYDHPITREDVETIIAMEDGENDGPDWVGFFKLKNGLYLGIEAGCDYTGWD